MSADANKTVGRRIPKGPPPLPLLDANQPEEDDAVGRLVKVLQKEVRSRTGVDLDPDDPALVLLEAQVFAARESGSTIRNAVLSAVEYFEGVLEAAEHRRARSEREMLGQFKATILSASAAFAQQTEGLLLNGSVAQRVEVYRSELFELVERSNRNISVLFVLLFFLSICVHGAFFAYQEGLF